MNPELEKKLIDDLEKSGFGSEMRAIKIFLGRGWACTGFADYYDLDNEQTRQIDLHAYRIKVAQLEGGVLGSIDYYIEAEVKKSEKPWILFKEAIQGSFYCEAWGNTAHLIGHGIEPSALSDALDQDSLTKKLGWKGYGIHESFKKPESPSRWYPAFISVCKAAEDLLERNYHIRSRGLSEGPQQGMRSYGLAFVKPLIILDGMLLAASLTDTSDVSIEEVKFAATEFTFKSKSCQKGRYYVDIVTLRDLEEYLALSETRHINLLGALQSLKLANP